MEASFDDIARDGYVNNELRLALSKALSTKAARLRYEAFLERAPAFIAAKVKRRQQMCLHLPLQLGSRRGKWPHALSAFHLIRPPWYLKYAAKSLKQVIH